MLTPYKRLLCPLFVCLVFASPAIAQDDPRFALVASFPSPTVSFQWELRERFALRFDGSYSHRDETSERVTSSTSILDFPRQAATTLTQRTVTDSRFSSSTIGLAGIVTIRDVERLRPYLAPRIQLSFISSEVSETTTISLPPGSSATLTVSPPSRSSDDSYTAPGAGLSFGASSNVHDRVALFGEAGLTYMRSNAPATIPPLTSSLGSDTRRTTLNTRAVAGVMFLF